MSRFIILIISALIFISCSQKSNNPVDSGQNTSGTMSFAVSLVKILDDYNVNVDSVCVSLQGPTSISAKLTIKDSTASGTFVNLTQGNYTITVYMFSGTDTVASGTGIATVLPGQQTTANITISFLPGKLIINVSLPPSNGTVLAYYPFNGNAADASGNGKNGTTYGATLTTDRFGNINSAYSFDGVSNYIAVPTLFSKPPSEFSLSAFIKATTPANNTQNMIYFSGQGGEFELFINNHCLNFSVILNNGTWYTIPYYITLSTWHHVTATYQQGNRIELFIDGASVGSLSLPNVALYDPGSSFATSIGCYNRYMLFFPGQIDDLRIFNYVLSTANVNYYCHENGW
ncbi:MAG: LamG domain-containing protein [Ignavibacteriaceae bacterium]|nr:LamG domain-containing protein [Ignavibacteriaceae bacterium]